MVVLEIDIGSWPCSKCRRADRFCVPTMGLFSCCLGSRKTVQGDADARHARIIEIYRQAEVESHQITQAPPPAYKDIVVCDSHAGTTIVSDEKWSPVVAQPQPQAQMIALAQTPISRPSSPQTSIYSVPSTRLTDITSTYTGATATVALTHQGDSPRSSMVFDSAPPSYYDGRSIRDRSRSPVRASAVEGDMHPVMANEWLDRLIRNANFASETR